jgi:hypothetical protein
VPCGSTPKAARVPDVYAFVADDVVVYVGLTRAACMHVSSSTARGTSASAQCAHQIRRGVSIEFA